MKLVKRFSLLAIVCMFLLTVASCGGINQKYADKINQAAKDENPITYEQVISKLGKDNIVDITIDAPVIGRNGVLIAVKGVHTKEDLQAKIDAGKDLKGIVITVAGSKAIAAAYKAITAEDLKAQKAE